METAEWQQIEKDFVEWDNATHSNASQGQIMDWFKKRLFASQSPALPEMPDSELVEIAKQEFDDEDNQKIFFLGAVKYRSEIAKRMKGEETPTDFNKFFDKDTDHAITGH